MPRGSKGVRHWRRMEPRDPVRFLVLGIIRRAILDAAGEDRCPLWAEITAREFLMSEEYRAFCEYLGVRPSLAKEAAKKAMDGSTRRSYWL